MTGLSDSIQSRMDTDEHGWEKKRSGFRQKAEPFNIQMSAALCRDAATPDGRFEEVSDCIRVHLCASVIKVFSTAQGRLSWDGHWHGECCIIRLSADKNAALLT
jgi:hypothetical protein